MLNLLNAGEWNCPGYEPKVQYKPGRRVRYSRSCVRFGREPLYRTSSILRNRIRRGSALPRCPLACLLICAGIASPISRAKAQGSTTAAIVGRILDESGHGLIGVDVVVTNRATGISMHATSRPEGRYRVSGLEVGGPYSVTAHRIGSPVKTRMGLFLTLGQEIEVNITLQQQAVLLQAVETEAPAGNLFSRAHMGTESFLSDSTIHQMPVLNRDLYDLVRLVPQMSTWFTLAPSGAGPRLNSIRIDGISDQVPSSNLAAGQLYGGKVIPLDAVQEYQVLFSPFDVRQGSFAGSGVNVVTRTGTNELHGSVYAYGTNDHLGPDVPFVRNLPYEKGQAGLSVGGPIVPDRLLFFVASELQRREIPAPGPYQRPDLSSESGLPVSTKDIARFQELLNARGMDAGSAGPVTNGNPSASLFLRLDAPIPSWNSRVTMRGTYGHADSAIFARPTALAPTDCPSAACFPLSSLQHSRWVNKQSEAVQLVSNFANGAYNELLAGYVGIVSGFNPTVKAPLILVTVPGTAGLPAVLQSGTHEIATGQRNASSTIEFTDNLSVSAGPHRITAGLSGQWFNLRAFQLRGSYGVWQFTSLDSLQMGAASEYRVTRDTGSVTAASGGLYAAYVGDEWAASPRLTVTLGVRIDMEVLSAHPAYVAAIDSTFRLRTNQVPSGDVAWSPRLGFNYRLTPASDTPVQMRGGVGLFTGHPPLFWLFGGFAAYGLAARTLQCGSLPGDAGPAPLFQPDYRTPPRACAGGQSFGTGGGGEIDAIDSHLRLPQSMRASLAIDAPLPLGLLGTLEGLYTLATHSPLFSSINLVSPNATDTHGRVLYGAIDAEGIASPSRVLPRFGDVIAISSESRDYSYDLTGTLRKVGRMGDLQASLSYGRSFDVSSPRPVSALLADDWRYGRPIAGVQNNLVVGTSDFDQPLRIRVAGTLHSPWQTLSSHLSLYYVGGMGFPYTYVAGGGQGRGDLNADGAVGNDPIYIPRSALDTTEIRFAGSPAEVQSQQTGFERFIDGASCLRTQRGRIMARNSCRSPWMSLTNLSIRQTLPAVARHLATIELQVFNLLNLLNSHWGREAVPTGATLTTTSQIALLSQVGETTAAQPQPIYRFDPAMSRYNFDNIDTYYQIQLALRYSF